MSSEQDSTLDEPATAQDMISKNLELQRDELEAMRSIYGDDFTLEDPTNNTFSIMIHIGEAEGEEATLVISYTLDYPSASPPVYYLSIPWIRGEEKQIFHQVLDQLYKDSNGETVIVYVWVEKLRELLSKTDIHPAISDKAQNDEESSELQTKGDDDDLKGHVIITGDPLTDRKSTFQAHVATVNSVQQVKLVLSELYKNKKIASATHNMYAYRILINENTSNVNKSEKESCARWIQDCDDDGETHAGGRLLHLLQILNCQNVIVIVTRWYGGIMLYGDRFKHINNVARILLEQNGYIKKV